MKKTSSFYKAAKAFILSNDKVGCSRQKKKKKEISRLREEATDPLSPETVASEGIQPV